ncbi:MAG: hypothetical protein AAF990_24175 [Bacteroidota bacterium]
MNRFNWIYLGNNDKRYNVGLMHGAQSGHLLVYCNSKIILIDFKVLETKTYSLFIDEQLVNIVVERKGEQFYYGFEIDTKADTPLNRQRRKMEKKHLRQSLMLFAAMALVVAAFTYGFMYFNSVRSKVELADKLDAVGKETHAQIILPENGDSESVSYFFIVDGKAYTVKEEREDAKQIILETGMPLEEGDEFIVRYIPNNPKQHTIDYKRPTSHQLSVYKDRAVNKYLQEGVDKDTSYVQCLADVAFELKGIGGYADIYFQDTSPEVNPAHNTDSFRRLVRDVPFQNRVREKCEKF